MAIRTVKIECLLSYNERQAWNQENSPLIASECTEVSGVVTGEGVQIRTYILDPSGKYSQKNYKSSFAEAHFYVASDTVRHVGMTVTTFSRVERIMSDVWEDVLYIVSYDPATESFVTEHAPHCGAFAVDATEEVKALYEAYKAGKAAGESFANSERAIATIERQRLEYMRRIAKGKVVRVVKGRKVPVGTQGEVFWMKDSAWGMRLGIATSDRTDARGNWMDVAWVAAGNCSVIDNQGNVI